MKMDPKHWRKLKKWTAWFELISLRTACRRYRQLFQLLDFRGEIKITQTWSSLRCFKASSKLRVWQAQTSLPHWLEGCRGRMRLGSRFLLKDNVCDIKNVRITSVDGHFIFKTRFCWIRPHFLNSNPKPRLMIQQFSLWRNTEIHKWKQGD